MKVAVCALTLVASASAFSSTPRTQSSTAMKMSLKDDLSVMGKAALASAVAVSLAVSPAQALTKSEVNQLSYLQVKGTGLANRCSEVIGEGTITPKPGQKLVDMCIEPKAWAVEEEIGKAGKTEKKFVNSKVILAKPTLLKALRALSPTKVEISSSRRKRALTMQQLPFRCLEVSVYPSFSL